MGTSNRINVAGDFLNVSEHDEIGLEYVLPVQFFQRRRTASWPTIRLLLAVIDDVIPVLQSKDTLNFATDAAKRRAYEEAHDWVASDEDWGLFSFIRICRALDLEPSWVRRRLRRLQQSPSVRRLSRHQTLRRLGKVQVGSAA